MPTGPLRKTKAAILKLPALENKLSELEDQIKMLPTPKETVAEKPAAVIQLSENELIRRIINDKYYSVYFDLNKTVPNENPTAASNAVLTYLRKLFSIP